MPRLVKGSPEAVEWGRAMRERRKKPVDKTADEKPTVVEKVVEK